MTAAAQAPPLLQVRDLAVEFGGDGGVVKAVNGVSFDLHRGEIVALVGESGCGKSVTALALLRLVADPPGRITAGSIHFDGEDLLQIPLPLLRDIRGDRIAMIFQEAMNSLNPVHRIGRQIAEPLSLHRAMPMRDALAKAVDLLRSVRIPEALRRSRDYPHQFSGGMQQRAMIAMGMGCEPDIIIADEPTTALDVTIQAQLLELLQQQVVEKQTSILLITHNLGIVARYADRVNVMYAGRIVEQAKAEDIYDRPRHPYTLGLLQSVPRIDQAIGDKLTPIEGQPPDPINPPPGCPFRPRCRFAVTRCDEDIPLLRRLTDSQSIACWVDVDD